MQLTRNSQNGLQKVRANWLNRLQIYRTEGFERRPDEEGIETLMAALAPMTVLFERRPDEEGIETAFLRLDLELKKVRTTP